MRWVTAFACALAIGGANAAVPRACKSMVADIGEPEYHGSAPTHKVLCRLGYVLSHNHERRTPDWVVERLDPKRFTGPGDRNAQGNPFKPDPDLEPDERSELADYKSSGFDRGHMAPAASMKFSEEATEQSFYLSNMSPQIGPNMNRGIWADLEKVTREWSCARGTVIVITGPIYGEKEKWIGDKKRTEPEWVAVPEAFYKVAYDPNARRAIAFILPNQQIVKGKRRAPDVLKDYIVTVREVEERTGLELLSALSKRDKSRVSTSHAPLWPTKKCSTN